MTKYTAIVRKKPSLPMKYLFNNGLLVGRCLDYGCGRGFDATYYGVERYDPNWFPVPPNGFYDTITCNFVLNTVPKETEIDIIKSIQKILNSV